MIKAEWKEVRKYLKVQGKKDRFMITIPKKEVAEVLGLQGGEFAKVYIDKKNKRIMYQILPE